MITPDGLLLLSEWDDYTSSPLSLLWERARLAPPMLGVAHGMLWQLSGSCLGLGHMPAVAGSRVLSFLWVSWSFLVAMRNARPSKKDMLVTLVMESENKCHRDTVADPQPPPCEMRGNKIFLWAPGILVWDVTTLRADWGKWIILRVPGLRLKILCPEDPTCMLNNQEKKILPTGQISSFLSMVF